MMSAARLTDCPTFGLKYRRAQLPMMKTPFVLLFAVPYNTRRRVWHRLLIGRSYFRMPRPKPFCMSRSPVHQFACTGKIAIQFQSIARSEPCLMYQCKQESGRGHRQGVTPHGTLTTRTRVDGSRPLHFRCKRGWSNPGSSLSSRDSAGLQGEK
jgi:hypothetical protein